jgi:hypothetical protein
MEEHANSDPAIGCVADPGWFNSHQVMQEEVLSSPLRDRAAGAVIRARDNERSKSFFALINVSTKRIVDSGGTLSSISAHNQK